MNQLKLNNLLNKYIHQVQNIEQSQKQKIKLQSPKILHNSTIDQKAYSCKFYYFKQQTGHQQQFVIAQQPALLQQAYYFPTFQENQYMQPYVPTYQQNSAIQIIYQPQVASTVKQIQLIENQNQVNKILFVSSPAKYNQMENKYQFIKTTDKKENIIQKTEPALKQSNEIKNTLKGIEQVDQRKNGQDYIQNNEIPVYQQKSFQEYQIKENSMQQKKPLQQLSPLKEDNSSNQQTILSTKQNKDTFEKKNIQQDSKMKKTPFYYANLKDQLNKKENQESIYENCRILEKISARRSPAKQESYRQYLQQLNSNQNEGFKSPTVESCFGVQKYSMPTQLLSNSKHNKLMDDCNQYQQRFNFNEHQSFENCYRLDTSLNFAHPN